MIQLSPGGEVPATTGPARLGPPPRRRRSGPKPAGNTGPAGIQDPASARLVQALTCAPADPKVVATTALTAVSWAAAGLPRLRAGPLVTVPLSAVVPGTGRRGQHRHRAHGGGGPGRTAQAAANSSKHKHVVKTLPERSYMGTVGPRS